MPGEQWAPLAVLVVVEAAGMAASIPDHVEYRFHHLGYVHVKAIDNHFGQDGCIAVDRMQHGTSAVVTCPKARPLALQEGYCAPSLAGDKHVNVTRDAFLPDLPDIGSNNECEVLCQEICNLTIEELAPLMVDNTVQLSGGRCVAGKPPGCREFGEIPCC